MNDIYEDTLYPKTKGVLETIQHQPLLQDFYLAGGTALALQIGHRKSIDLDFFISELPSTDQIITALSSNNPTITQQTQSGIDMYIQEVKVSFLQYSYPLLAPLVSYQQIKLASIEDIACMKVSAIASRGMKKDFVDIFFILKIMSLEDLLHNFQKKYQGIQYQTLHLLKSLVYFNDAEGDPDPDYLTPVDWEEVKSTLQSAVLKVRV